jgi:hypothetical protein
VPGRRSSLSASAKCAETQAFTRSLVCRASSNQRSECGVVPKFCRVPIPPPSGDSRASPSQGKDNWSTPTTLPAISSNTPKSNSNSHRNFNLHVQVPASDPKPGSTMTAETAGQRSRCQQRQAFWPLESQRPGDAGKRALLLRLSCQQRGPSRKPHNPILKLASLPITFQGLDMLKMHLTDPTWLLQCRKSRFCSRFT